MTKQEDYARRQRAKGLNKICVWVPADKAERLKKYAEKLRREDEKQ